jgi:valyl-tRNA synthetase
MSLVHLVSIPPAFTSGKPHHGHALYLTLIDSANNLFKSLNYKTKLVLGYDTHGLPIKMKVKELKSVKYNKEFPQITLARRFSVEAIKAFEELVDKLGVKIDQRWTTEDLFYQITVDKFFEEATKKNLIYSTESIQEYCVYCEEYLAESELGVKNVEKNVYSMNWVIEGIVYKVMTTRPQLITNAVAIAVNPSLTNIKGEYAYIETLNIRVPVIRDNIAKLDENSNGFCMVSFCGSRNDYEFIKKYKLGYKNYLDTEKRFFNEQPYVYVDKELFKEKPYINVERAVHDITKELIRNNVITLEKKTVGLTIIHGERASCQKRIEYNYSNQLYLAVEPLREKLLNMLNSIEFYPQKYRVIIKKWIENAHDWCIGRKYPWGSHINLVESKSLKILENILEEPIVDYYFDVWFESAISWYYTTKCASELNLDYASIQVQGYEILNTWFFYSLIAAIVLDKRVPFEKVKLTPLLLNSEGKKYSKSMKNYISPNNLMDAYGTSAFRLWGIQQKSDADSIFNEEEIKNAKKSLIKLNSICKFYKKYYRERVEELVNFEEGQKLYKELIQLIKTHVESVKSSYDYSKIKLIISFIHNELSRVFLTTYYDMRETYIHNLLLGKMLKLILEQIMFICPDILQQTLFPDMKEILF